MKPTDLTCYQQVAAVIGEAYADYELQRVLDCELYEYKREYIFGFIWGYSPQGGDFWNLVNIGKNPYEHGHEKPEVKEWAYIRCPDLEFEDEWYYKDGDKWVASDDTYYNVDGDGIEILATHKSVTMPDWVPDHTGLELPETTPRFEKEGKEVFVPESESGDKERSKVTAASILEAGLCHMQDRAVTYDNPQGERSMGKTVDMFNVLYGLELTEEQGWAFMTILKLVRTGQGEFKLDNFEDMAAYAGLMGEAASEKSKV